MKSFESDKRPQRYGWAPGDYMCRCHGGGCKDKSDEDRIFIGDKRAIICADCAYAMPDPIPVDRVVDVIDGLVRDHQMKWSQAVRKPVLLGWFVGQTMKALRGAADVDDVMRKVMLKAGQK